MTNPSVATKGVPLVQAAALKRCASCERWLGERRVAPDGAAVEIADAGATGICCGGPWDGEMRRARSACGHWTRWTKLGDPEDFS